MLVGQYEKNHTHPSSQLNDIPALKEATEIVIGAEDVHKNLETLASVWQALSEQGATRHSLLINLGGGMVTDLGGFAASTFKRGIAYINIPTTLLAMVDASVGGKTGINFNGLKNEIGVFAPAASVLLETEFLRSLDAHNFFSGLCRDVEARLCRLATVFISFSTLLGCSVLYFNTLRCQCCMTGKGTVVAPHIFSIFFLRHFIPHKFPA